GSAGTAAFARDIWKWHTSIRARHRTPNSRSFPLALAGFRTKVRASAGRTSGDDCCGGHSRALRADDAQNPARQSPARETSSPAGCRVPVRAEAPGTTDPVELQTPSCPASATRVEGDRPAPPAG